MRIIGISIPVFHHIKYNLIIKTNEKQNNKGSFPEGFLAQLQQVLENTVAVLQASDAGPEHIVRMTWFVKDLDVYRQNIPAVGQIYRKVIGKNFPAMAVVGVNDLVEREAMLEIETTAVVP